MWTHCDVAMADEMMLPSARLAQHRDAVIQAAHRRGAERLWVFGSVARGDDREDSDVDLHGGGEGWV